MRWRSCRLATGNAKVKRCYINALADQINITDQEVPEAVDAVAEHLPNADKTFDASMATLLGDRARGFDGTAVARYLAVSRAVSA